MALSLSEMQEYMDLKQLIMRKLNESSECSSIVNSIKQKNKYIINSNRLFERIDHPILLFKILEKRAFLSPTVLTPFEDVNKFLRDPEINCSIKNITRNCTNGQPNSSADKLKEMHSLVVNNIGPKYRELARFLDVPESETSVAEMQFPTDIHSRIWKVLTYAFSQFDNEEQYFAKLCKSLENCRRMDLRNKITKIWNE